MNYALKLSLLRKALNDSEDGAHEHIVDMFLSMLATDNFTGWITTELIRGLQDLEKDFPNCVHLNYCINKLKTKDVL